MNNNQQRAQDEDDALTSPATKSTQSTTYSTVISTSSNNTTSASEGLFPLFAAFATCLLAEWGVAFDFQIDSLSIVYHFSPLREPNPLFP